MVCQSGNLQGKNNPAWWITSHKNRATASDSTFLTASQSYTEVIIIITAINTTIINQVVLHTYSAKNQGLFSTR